MEKTTSRSITDIANEYNELYRTQPVRDDDRAYTWHAKNIKKIHPKAKTILDIACGGGYFLRELHKVYDQKISLRGIDISQTALDIATVECPQAHLEISQAEHMPFSNSSVDMITCLGSLEHFMDIPKAVKEMIRITPSDAKFYILVPNIFWYKDILNVILKGTRISRNQTHERFASLGEWIETLEQSGLKVIKALKYNGIAKRSFKQFLKDLLIPLRFSYHFIFICKKPPSNQ